MAKYRDGSAGIRGHENRTIRFPWIRPVLLRQEAHPINNTGHYRYEIQTDGIIVDRSVDISYVAPQEHRIVNVALHREYSPGIVFIFSQGRKHLYHV
jgi:hypothetical protein